MRYIHGFKKSVITVSEVIFGENGNIVTANRVADAIEASHMIKSSSAVKQTRSQSNFRIVTQLRHSVCYRVPFY